MGIIIEGTNIVQLVESLRAGLRDFGFDSRSVGPAGSVGESVRETFATAIHDRSFFGEDPDGAMWAANSDKPPGKGYASYKQQELGHQDPNVFTGQMISPSSIRGELQTLHHEIDYKYGLGVRAVTPDGKIEPTDRNRAQWAHEPNRHTGVTRPFFGITEADADAATEQVASALIAELRG